MEARCARAFVDELAYIVGSVKVALVKEALPRFEREIAAGRINRSDVVPGSSDVKGGVLGAAARTQTRNQLYEAAPVAPDVLSRHRALKDKIYQAQTTDKGSKGLGVKARVTREMDAGGVAATVLDRAGVPVVHAPEVSGQFLRGMTGSKADIASSRAGALASSKSKVPQHFISRAPVDSTLNHAILQHEVGEAAEMQRPSNVPFASHFGVEPIMRENMATHGDPEAQKILAAARKRHPEDRLVQRMIRQSGGTPDSPLPLGGRQQSRLNARIADSVGKQRAARAAKKVSLVHVPHVAPRVVESVSNVAHAAQNAHAAQSVQGTVGAAQAAARSFGHAGFFAGGAGLVGAAALGHHLWKKHQAAQPADAS